MSTKNNEWYTPSLYVEAARRVMGSIDLDPASCVQANCTVRAKRFYTQEENGLMLPWYGRVFCNPPYGRVLVGAGNMSYQKAFAQKLQSEWHAGNIEQAILLSLGNPNSLWFQPFYDYPVCHVRGDIEFMRENGEMGHFGFPLAFIYLGANEERFINEFRQFGRLVRGIDAAPSLMVRELWS